MTEHQMIDGVAVPLSEDEIAELTARRAAWEAGAAERDRLAHNAPILAALAGIDLKRVRPTAAITAAQAAGQTPDPADIARLAELETEAAALRAQLQAAP